MFDVGSAQSSLELQFALESSRPIAFESAPMPVHFALDRPQGLAFVVRGERVVIADQQIVRSLSPAERAAIDAAFWASVTVIDEGSDLIQP